MEKENDCKKENGKKNKEKEKYSKKHEGKEQSQGETEKCRTKGYHGVTQRYQVVYHGRINYLISNIRFYQLMQTGVGINANPHSGNFADNRVVRTSAKLEIYT